MQFITIPLGWILQLGYLITGSFGLAILFFAFVSKAITFPLALAMQKNSIALLKIQPKMDYITRTHYGDRDRINEEQYQLFKQEHYSPFSGLWPLIAQMVLLVGMVNVIYDPFKHLPELADSFFLGLDLNVRQSQLPVMLVLPFLSGLSNLALCLVQNRLNPAQRRMRFWGKWGMSIFMISFSVYFPFVTQAAIGLYWFYSNILGIFVALATNAMLNPKKLVAPELLLPPPKIGKEEKARLRSERLELAKLEKSAIERFYSDSGSKLVFYSISGGQHKFYSEIIDYILGHSDIVVHYVTNDPKDPLLSSAPEKLKAYYVGEKRAIRFMLTLKAKVVVMTAPNLQQYHLKRSIADIGIEYVYTWHHFTSLMILREGALDHFDTVFCVGPHQIEEIRRTEQLYNLKKKKLVKVGYGQMDKLARLHSAGSGRNSPAQILVAPSWSDDNLFESCLDEIVSGLKKGGYKIVIRPHPEYRKRFPENWDSIKSKYRNDTVIDEVFASQETIYQSDLVITDWSSIAYEYAYCTKRPVLFVNTAMKVMNSDFEKLGVKPLDVIIRSEVGASIDKDKLSELPAVVSELLNNPEKYRQSIESSFSKWLFHPGRSGEAGGEYLINAMKG
jgi:YidC/Oxa1 family membrane protein insertase